MSDWPNAQLILKGNNSSFGIAIGKAAIYKKNNVALASHSISPLQIANEIVRLDQAISKTCSELEHQKQVSNLIDITEHISIIDAHILLATDPIVRDTVIEQLNSRKINVEQIYRDVTSHFAQMLKNCNSVEMQVRAEDILNVAEMILNHLHSSDDDQVDISKSYKEDTIVVTKNLTPSKLIEISNSGAKGFITEEGSASSHVAIMAKSIRMPGVLGLENATNSMISGDEIIVDGIENLVYVEPSDKLLNEYKIKAKDLKSLRSNDSKLEHSLVNKTKDDVIIELCANIQNPNDINYFGGIKPDNIGLFRTEFLFLNEESIPNEEEQFQIYKQMAKSGYAPVTIRTFDLGGDKFNKLITLDEKNPFLGTRGSRLALALPDLLEAQLRAIIRASAYGKLRILLPMITTVEEILLIKEMIANIKHDLLEKSQSFDHDIEIGIMLEVPAAVMIADLLAKYVNFFSIGTNDLCQYLMGVDRSNTKMDHLYQPSHPAMIRLLQRLAQACDQANIKLSLCGEIGGDTNYLPLLLGCGLRSFSMNAVNINLISDTLRLLTIDECKALVEKVSNYESSERILEASINLLKSK